MVNFAPEAQQVDVELLGLHTSPQMMTVTTLNGTNGLIENSFDEPFMVSLLQVVCLDDSKLCYYTYCSMQSCYKHADAYAL